jgi:glycosyltransferase involved in cell wall biosynthesis
MRFSIIIPSYLGEYRTAANNRDKKIVRAVNSALTQSFQDFEVIVIADGCEKTMEIIKRIEDKRVSSILIPKCRGQFSNQRDTGIEAAKGEFILYLDIDDLFGTDHLKNINAGLNGFDWVWFDDIRYMVKTKEWYQNPCDIMKMGRHGTSNICHKQSLPYRWDHTGYAHDYYFIKHLKQNMKYKKIEGGEYYVCHLPDSILGKGYDL